MLLVKGDETMFDLNICKETNDFLKEIRKELKNKGYNMSMSRTNRYIGTMHLNYVNEYYTRPKTNIMFEIEKDLENNTMSAMLHFKDENGKNDFKRIRLADIIDLA